MTRGSTGTIAAVYDRNNNAIGFLRLTFAATVIVSHTWPLGGWGNGPGRGDNNLGILAVEGFFALSGFLITSSAFYSRNLSRYLWHRILRIFPGFWVSLIVVATILAPLASVVEAGSSLTPWDAAGYVLRNLALHMFQDGIGSTLSTVPFERLWNGPLYTLEIEFSCYLLVAVLAAFKLLRPHIVAATTVVCWLWLTAGGVGSPLGDDRQARFTFAFLVGATLFMYARQVPMSNASGAAALTGAAATYLLGGFSIAGIALLVYAVLWSSTVLPFRLVGAKAPETGRGIPDISYGVYVYGCPVQQLMSASGVNDSGPVIYLVAVALVTGVLATASWYAVEAPMLRLKDWSPSRLPSRSVARRGIDSASDGGRCALRTHSCAPRGPQEVADNGRGRLYGD